MLGIAFGMFLCLEFGYRLVAGSERQRPGAKAPLDDPYFDSDWYREFTFGPDGPAARHYVLDPYRFHRLAPMKTRFIEVDSQGHRRTPGSPPPAEARQRVFMLGGSTMWGFSVRDSFTIPAYFARALRSRGLHDVQVLNLAESGYNSTQEATTLLFEIAGGNIPDAAVFLNGYNDMVTAFKWRAPGMVYDRDRTQQLVDAGRAGFGGKLLALGQESRLVRRLTPRPAEEDEETVGGEGKVTMCPAIADYYSRVARATASLGEGFGFPVFYFLQPMHHLTAKPLSKHERSFRRDPAFLRCTQLIDSLMQDWEGSHYFHAYSFFDQDSVTRFVDRNTHLTEEANRVLAERMADVLVPVLLARSAAGRNGDSPRAGD
jgi:hypothetical protein